MALWPVIAAPVVYGGQRGWFSFLAQRRLAGRDEWFALRPLVLLAVLYGSLAWLAAFALTMVVALCIPGQPAWIYSAITLLEAMIAAAVLLPLISAITLSDRSLMELLHRHALRGLPGHLGLYLLGAFPILVLQTVAVPPLMYWLADIPFGWVLVYGLAIILTLVQLPLVEAAALIPARRRDPALRHAGTFE